MEKLTGVGILAIAGCANGLRDNIDRQVMAIIEKVRIENEEVREWVRTVLRSQTKDEQA